MSVVRNARVEDVPGILPMVRAICAMHAAMDPARFDFLPDVVARYERWLPQRAVDPRSVLLVAEVDGDGTSTGTKGSALAGFLVGTVESNVPIYRTTEFGFIHDVWVEPRFRGSGLGARLVDEAVARFRAIGVTQVRLETAAKNDEARAVFERRGFRVSAIDMMWGE